MATISEDYVSFEIAKLLRDKGFNEHCYTYYDDIDDTINRFDKGYHFNNTSYPWGVPYDVNKAKKYVVAPTLQMAMKWLREVHGLHISVDVCPIYGKVKDEKGRNTCGLLYWHYMASCEWINDKYNPRQKAFVVSEKSYKKAIDAALKHCLENLI